MRPPTNILDANRSLDAARGERQVTQPRAGRAGDGIDNRSGCRPLTGLTGAEERLARASKFPYDRSEMRVACFSYASVAIMDA